MWVELIAAACGVSSVFPEITVFFSFHTFKKLCLMVYFDSCELQVR